MNLEEGHMLNMTVFPSRFEDQIFDIAKLSVDN